MWDWYEWDSLDEFDAWHTIIKAQLGLPKKSIDQYGQECLPIIDSYTNAFQVADKWIARVESVYAENLTLTELRLPKPDVEA